MYQAKNYAFVEQKKKDFSGIEKSFLETIVCDELHINKSVVEQYSKQWLAVD